MILNDTSGIPFFLESTRELPEDIKREIKVVILWHGPLQEYAKDIGGKGTYFEYLGLLDYKEMPVYHKCLRCVCHSEAIKIARRESNACEIVRSDGNEKDCSGEQPRWDNRSSHK